MFRACLLCAMMTAGSAILFAQDPPQEPATAPATKRPLPPEAAAEMKKHGHGPGNLKPGDMAVDFDLKQLKSDERIALSSFRGRRPVALVFGSYT
ncbi:MAG: hypothetical protein JNL98_28115 [Bryobacterales bacterium]|nr:hypothetical protein [Bryobacterales bacterium]